MQTLASKSAITPSMRGISPRHRPPPGKGTGGSSKECGHRKTVRRSPALQAIAASVQPRPGLSTLTALLTSCAGLWPWCSGVGGDEGHSKRAPSVAPGPL